VGQARRDVARAHTILRERTGGVATATRVEPAVVPAPPAPAKEKEKAARRVSRTPAREKKTTAKAKKRG
jgi:hypothetical protein